MVFILLLLYLNKSLDIIISIFLIVVFFNVLFGFFVYFRMKCIDYKLGIIFVIVIFFGLILGLVIILYVFRYFFNGIFGVILVIVLVFLIIRIKKEIISNNIIVKKGYVIRIVIDIEGNEYIFLYNLIVGVVISVFVGFMFSFLGIGGGIIYVLVLVNILNYLVYIVIVILYFVLVVMLFLGIVVYIVDGVF